MRLAFDWPRGTERSGDRRPARNNPGMAPREHRSQIRTIASTSSTGATADRQREVEGMIIRMAEENRSRGYDRIVGALANLGH